MKPLFNLFLRLARCSSGNAFVEMAIILPVAISLMAGGVDFGLWASTQATGSKSVRNAARYMGSLPTNIGCPGWAVQNAQYLAVYGQMNAGTPLIPTWQTSNVTVTCAPFTDAEGNAVTTVTVRATFPYNSIMLATFLRAGSLTLSTQHEELQVGPLQAKVFVP